MTINEYVKKWSDVAFSDDSDLGLERILSLCLIDFAQAGPDAGQAAIEIARDCCLNIGTELDYDNTRAASIIQRAINRAVVQAIEEKNRAYTERNQMVLALTMIWPSHMKRHPEIDTEWEDDWRNIVCIHGPAGQMAWHIHDREAANFGHLNRKPDPFENCMWDGHSTPEKYARLLRSAAQINSAKAVLAKEEQCG